MSNRFTIRIADDKMKAFISCEAGDACTKDQVNIALTTGGIRAGIIDAALAKLVQQTPEPSFACKHGRPSRPMS